MRGIAIVAFGENYERFAAKCMHHSRAILEYPVEVFTNVKNVDPLWKEIQNLKTIYMNLPTDQNRDIKTSIDEYTSFDECLYIDCDSIFQLKGLKKYFEMIPQNGMLLNTYGTWDKSYQIPPIYQRAFKMAAIKKMPIDIYYGACFMFRKCYEVRQFFQLWNYFWMINGNGREMPSLACAVRNSRIDKVCLSRSDGLFSWPVCNSTIIQHEYQGHLKNLVGCSEFQPYKPFDDGGWSK
jgi:hypothetical protein